MDYTVSEDTTIVLDGEKYLLQKGDKINVTEAVEDEEEDKASIASYGMDREHEPDEDAFASYGIHRESEPEDPQIGELEEPESDSDEGKTQYSKIKAALQGAKGEDISRFTKKQSERARQLFSQLKLMSSEEALSHLKKNPDDYSLLIAAAEKGAFGEL